MFEPEHHGPHAKKYEDTLTDANWLIKKKEFKIIKVPPPPPKAKPDIRPPAEIVHKDFSQMNKNKLVNFKDDVEDAKIKTVLTNLNNTS